MNNKRAKTFAIKMVESILVIGYILFEELIWNVFANPIYQYFKSLIVLDSLKKTFLEMNRYFLLFIFIFILLIAEALGFLSGYCFINGYVFSGIGVYVSKIPIAAFTFWLFDLTKDQLMTFNWLKITYQYILNMIDKFVHTTIHIYLKERISKIRATMKQLVLNYFGKEGFIASVKKHYQVFKPYLSSMIGK